MAGDKPLKSQEMPLDGKLVTAVDPIMIGSNFQELKNMRYSDTNPRSVKGMTKINTTALSNHPKISNGFHFKKEQPAESHVLVQAYNSGETESKVYENKTAIPNAGDFQGNTLHTDDSSAGMGRFSDAPNGNVAYCNGAESLIWGGDEHFVSGFINYDPDGSWSKDYTERTQNTLTDTDNIAYLTSVSSSLPTNTKLLLHFDDNVNDAVGTHTPVNNNVTFGVISKFGKSGVFNRTSSYITVPDHADFDFSGGIFTVDSWVKLNVTTTGTIWSQSSGANDYIRLQYSLTSGLIFDVYAAGASVVSLSAFPHIQDLDHFHHIEITESGNNWYLFVDGVMLDYSEDASRAANYTNDFHIGAFYDGATVSDYFGGSLDEFRVSNGTALHTDFFDPREVPYGTSGTYVLIGAVRPLKGIEVSVGTANASTGTTKVYEWVQETFGVPLKPNEPDMSNHHLWSSVSSLTDGTASSGKPLAQDGAINFNDTASTAYPKIEINTYLYWYKVVFEGIDDNTTISHITLDMAMQGIKDLWDGDVRSPVYFEVDTGTNKFDNTINVFEGTYTSDNSATYSDLSALPSSGFLLAGYTERITALDIRFLAGEVNTNVGGAAKISYWSWDGWYEALLQKDGTRDANSSFGKSGVISWNVVEHLKETKQEIGGRPPLYYYKIELGITVSATCKAYYIGGIPTQKQIDGYKFPLLSHNRLMLGSNQDDKKNELLIGAPDTSSIFNGVESRRIRFGNDDELVAGAEIYGQFDSNLYNLTLLCKKGESWLLSEQESSFEYYRVSDSIGCTAPLTMTSVHTVPTETRPPINGAIFQSTDAIYLFDGREFYPIHRDIEDVFTRINKTYLDKSDGFLDETNQEWHWLITTGASTTHNEEWAYDLKRDRWHQIDRTSYLQSGFKVEDTVGNFYTYGTLDTGYMERLENGTDFDGNDIVSSFRTGDVAVGGSTMYETRIRHIHLIAKSKNTTANSVAMTHYGDGETTGTTLTSISPANATGRIISKVKSENLGQHVFHSLKASMTTNDETTGFEPLALGVFYQEGREHKGIKNN